MTDGNDRAYPAFDKYNSIAELGLTKREYMSAMAMQGMLANPELFKIMSDKLSPEHQCEFLNGAAIEQADDMIEQLNKQQ
jgi:hypothetical protein